MHTQVGYCPACQPATQCTTWQSMQCMHDHQLAVPLAAHHHGTHAADIMHSSMQLDEAAHSQMAQRAANVAAMLNTTSDSCLSQLLAVSYNVTMWPCTTHCVLLHASTLCPGSFAYQSYTHLAYVQWLEALPASSCQAQSQVDIHSHGVGMPCRQAAGTTQTTRHRTTPLPMCRHRQCFLQSSSTRTAWKAAGALMPAESETSASLQEHSVGNHWSSGTPAGSGCKA
jgi:hypothetical protein